jgi:NAD(P)H-dependent FMN reductase
MINIAVIIGSTRPSRNGEAVAKWVYEIAKTRTDAEFELVDISVPLGRFGAPMRSPRPWCFSHPTTVATSLERSCWSMAAFAQV